MTTEANPFYRFGVALFIGLLIGMQREYTADQYGLEESPRAVLAGALAYWDQVVLAVALAVITTGLLSLKLELHGFVERLTREDIFAVLKFALITAIVLPVLPNETFGPPPFDVPNLYTIWLLVVLILGISLLGYVLMKLLDAREGITLTGLLGGLASSTTTTLSFAERSKKTTTRKCCCRTHLSYRRPLPLA